MILKKIRLLVLLLMTMAPVLVSAESSTMDFLRSTGKIYSVVAVLAIIFIGILYFLIRLDRKLTKLENHIDNEHKTS